MIDQRIQQIIFQSTHSSKIINSTVIQNLWSGYGKIYRIQTDSDLHQNVVAKHVHFPETVKHPRGWNSDLSHQRKLKSYEVEMAWYKHWSLLCDDSCRIPKCLALEDSKDEVLIVMEDLDQVGFSLRKNSVSWNEVIACLKWLASFHATFLGENPTGLWRIGTYWHLDTRPEELKVLTDNTLKNAAKAIDDKLNNATFKTIVHGDAKLANFCFSNNGENVAAVDFQYVGGGCGMKDVAYFVGSCLYEDDCERLESQLLSEYFAALKRALENRNKMVDFDALESEWRKLYPFAWTDFHRFLKGWSPDHWKINSYSERLNREVVAALK